MSIIVPNVAKVNALNLFLNRTLVLKIYGNNVTLGPATQAADLTEVAGPDYASVNLLFANWTITPGSPSRALYNTRIVFAFTTTLTAPGTAYGYYVVDTTGNLKWAERFPAAAVPFVPTNGSIIKITPRFSAASIVGD